MNKKIISIILLCIMSISLLAACAGQGATSTGDAGTGSGSGVGDGASGSASTTNLSGNAMEVLAKLDEDLKQTGIEMPMTLPPTAVNPDMSQNDIGLSDTDFAGLVESAASSLAAIGTFAHQIVIIQAKDANAAVKVKDLISGPGGYDAQKWICVWPEKVIAVESGAYVLLAAANANVVDAAVEAFRAEAGNIGTVVTFFEHDGSNDNPVGGGEPIALG